MTDTKTLTQIVYYFPDRRPASTSPFAAEGFFIDAEQGDLADLGGADQGGDVLVFTDKTVTEKNGTKKVVNGSRVVIPKGYLMRVVSEVTRERKDTDPVRVA